MNRYITDSYECIAKNIREALVAINHLDQNPKPPDREPFTINDVESIFRLSGTWAKGGYLIPAEVQKYNPYLKNRKI